MIGGQIMKTFARICGAISFAGWTFLCVGAACGYITVEPVDYCIAVGLLAVNSLFTIIRGY
jgi:hypothetical protein